MQENRWRPDHSDERAHPPGSDALWNEAWSFDYFASDGSVGGWVRLDLFPNLGTAWYHAYVVGPRRRTVAVADLEVALPRPGSLELRSHGLWAEHTCESPFDHWSLGNEAFALAVDHPDELARSEPRGDHMPMGVDLEWETDGAPFGYDAGNDVGDAGLGCPRMHYEVPCRVLGEVLVGDERIELDGWGQRTHSWGETGWSSERAATSGRFDDGSRFHGVHEPGPPVSDKPARAMFVVGERSLVADPLAVAPTLLTLEGKVSKLTRALCRYRADDGRAGVGWSEWNRPE